FHFSFWPSLAPNVLGVISGRSLSLLSRLQRKSFRKSAAIAPKSTSDGVLGFEAAPCRFEGGSKFNSAQGCLRATRGFYGCGGPGCFGCLSCWARYWWTSAQSSNPVSSPGGSQASPLMSWVRFVSVASPFWFQSIGPDAGPLPCRPKP